LKVILNDSSSLQRLLIDIRKSTEAVDEIGETIDYGRITLRPGPGIFPGTFDLLNKLELDVLLLGMPLIRV
jgi:hypothetical protein